MSNEVETMPFLESLGLSITAKCPVACSHCIVEAGPRRTEEMSAEDADEWLRQASRYRNGHIKSVVITGGEPFYNLALLRQVVDSAQRNRLVPAVVTNAFWATETALAVELLESLPGIRMLAISADAYHQRSIPLRNIENAVLAASKLGVKHNLALCYGEEDDPKYLALRHRLEQMIDPALIRVAAVYPAGRAARQLSRDGAWMTEPPCGACTAADFPTVFPDGRLIGCMGIVTELPGNHPLNFGSLRERPLAQLLDESEMNVALHILRVWGPARLLQLLAEAGHDQRLPKRFRKHAYCDLCYALLSDDELRKAVKAVTTGNDLTRKTAYARVYCLKEETMLRRVLEHPAVEGEADRGTQGADGAAGEKESEPSFLENIGFLITYRCQVACPHCIVGAGPNRTEQMSTEDVFAWLDQAASYRNGRIRTACFTGGEPFYDVDRLGQMCLWALSRGILPTAVTNAFWAETPRRARETLEQLPGLRVISVSTDAHHLAHIPFSKVENALTAAKDLGLTYNVAVCTEDVEDGQYRALIERLLRIVDRDRISTVVTFPVGRAAGFVNIAKYKMTDQPPAGACAGAHTPVIFPDGRVSACIGPVIDLHTRNPMLLGNLREEPLDRILDAAETNAVLHIVRVWGPKKLLETLDEKGFGDRLPRRFVEGSVCTLCHSIMGMEGLGDAVAELERDTRLMEKIAYARQYYLSETTMVEAAGLAAPVPET